ncbi:MAG: amidohydrolase [Lachnospiraceae bacterium]
MDKRLILKNGKIYTSDKEQLWTDAICINAGRFESVGSENIDFAADDAQIIDLKGKVVLPGFIDSHTHIGLSVMMGGEDDSMPIWDCKSKAEILEELKKHVKKHPFRLYYAAFFGQVEALAGETLTREDIDKVVKWRPVILMEQECHSAWLNTGAMKFMKLREDVKDMAPGYSYYERDAEGRLTGCIKEMTMLPLLAMTGDVSKKDLKASILKIANYLLDHGVTTIYDAGNYFKEEETYKLLAEMDRAGELPIRYEGTYIITSPDKAEVAVDELKRYKALYETEHLKFNTVKIMFDGTHRIHTAKLVEPYNDATTTGGTMLSEDKLYELMKCCNEEGLDFHAHTVGEGASKMILDCVECIKNEQGELKINVTLAHLETQRDEDIQRFKELGVIGNFTPHWHGGNDYGTEEENARLLGEERANKLFRVKSMIDSGATVSFSSDEVTLQLLDRWNPFLGIETGHTRQEVTDGGKAAPIFPAAEERLTIEELVQGYTINGAYQLHMNNEIGSIEVGKKTDFMILDQDIFSIDPYDIHKIKPEVVVVEGKIVRGSF